MAHASGHLAFHDLLPPQQSMLDEVWAGLSKPQKELSPKLFYDARGCELFEAICGLPEYYPTRTEVSIMRAHAPAMARLLGRDCALIEIGCGNSDKTRALLAELEPDVFVAVDIAREQLEASCRVIAKAFPQMQVVALRADFAHAFELPRADLGSGRRVLYFPGSTIGNFTPAEAREFLARWAPLLGAGGAALIGVDLKKDPAILNAAYNDAQGVTAEFNLNVLRHINAELGANFDLAGFRHDARYVEATGRIEMHLVSLKAQRVALAGRMLEFRPGETIHTENSCKYEIAEFQALGKAAGFEARACWTDDDRLFSVHYFSLP
ncbi:MAG: dimethylhistidine N-methyltransferase [Betaproteobacteria bacterium]|nr:dimethylhistidine N-methyltransferase [Betaproteobacteria bacterium]